MQGLILAAGAGRRFGGGKQLSDFRGRPLLEWAIDAMVKAKSVSAFSVVLGSGAEEILARIDLGGARVVVCEGWSEGMGASLRAGLESLETTDGAVVTLGDQPFIGPEAIDRVCAGFDGGCWDAVRATYSGRPGHPVLLGPAVLACSHELTGDVGARSLLRRFNVREVPCDDVADPHDVDTPADQTR